MQALTTANKHSALLFSADLFSDIRLSLSADRSNYKPPRRLSGGKINQNNTFMQNKPNLRIAQMNTTPYLKRLYKKFTRRALWRANPNKPNSNPKQSQFQPLSHPPNPIQTQSPRPLVCLPRCPRPAWCRPHDPAGKSFLKKAQKMRTFYQFLRKITKNTNFSPFFCRKTAKKKRKMALLFRMENGITLTKCQ